MIVHKTNKTYQTRSKYPNSNWTGQDKYYVIDDASESVSYTHLDVYKRQTKA